MSDPRDPQDSGEAVAVFMGDPSAEAEGVAQALRSAGFEVVDVPLSMLVPRVAVQLPRVVVLDAEAVEAKGLIREIRALPGGQMIQVILLGGQGGGVEGNADHPLAEEAIDFFSRPVHAQAVVRKVELLTGGPGTNVRLPNARPSAPPSIAFGRRNLTPPPPASRSSRPQLAHSSPSPSPSPSPAPEEAGEAKPELPSHAPPTAASPSHAPNPLAAPSNPPLPAMPILPSIVPPSTRATHSQMPPRRETTSISQAPVARPSQAPSPASRSLSRASQLPRPSQVPREMRSSIPSLAAPPTGFSQRGSRQAPLSREIEQLLSDAEDRVSGPRVSDSMFPSPEEELAAVLPADLLASLDQPLEEEDDDDEPEREAPRGNTEQGRRSITSSGRRVREPSEAPEPAPSTHAPGRGPATGAGSEPHVTSFVHMDNPASSLGSMPSMRSEARPETRADARGEVQHTMPPSSPPGTGRESQRAQSIVSSSFGAGTPSYAPFARDRESAGGGFTFEQASRSYGGAPSISVPPTPMQPAVHMTQPPRTTGSASFGGSFVQSPQQASPPAHQAHQAPAGQAVVPSVLGPGDATRALAYVIAQRASGALSLENADGVRRVVLREGDVITAASGVDSETLLGFLAARGELPRDQVERLAGKVPPFGRHAGAALVAHGHLRQDQLWPVLRAHAEWIIGRALLVSSGTASLEAEPPGRLRGEPSVFGGATGGEVFVEAVRRVIAPDLAVQRLGGVGARLGFGPSSQMLAECNIEPTLRERLERGAGETVGALIGGAPEADIAAVLYALATLGVFETMRAISGAAAAGRPSDAASSGGDLLDVDAVRARVRARVQLVEEGDYFELLGIARDATGYEIRRAFLELRRVFEPSRILTPELADLKTDVDVIASVLDEAYEVLRDNPRRDRYRRAISD